MSRRTLLIALGASLALLVLWFFFLWSPQGSRIEEAEAREEAARDENAQLELRLARLRAAQEAVPAMVAELDQLRRAVPDHPELAEFILDANEIAAATDVDFLSISPSVPALSAGGLPPQIALSISVTGRYPAVLDYLDRLNSLPRIVVVDTLSLSPSEDILSVSISARMFTNSTAGAAIATTTTTAPPQEQPPVGPVTIPTTTSLVDPAESQG